MTASKNSILLRYGIIFFLVLSVCGAILFCAARTIFIEGEEWKKIAESLKPKERVKLPPRGNIYACDGRLMASSIQVYKLYIDFRADGLTEELLKKYIKPLSEALSKKLGDRTPAEYEKHILDNYKKKSRQFLISRKKVTYTDLQEIRQFPLFKKGSNVSGFYYEELISRKKPFGTLASHTIGGLYADYEKGGKNGIELNYDSILRGTPGFETQQKIRGKVVRIVNQEPVSGQDIYTTIDIDIQDITEKALREMLTSTNAQWGSAVVMEVKTGEVKAIANMDQTSNGSYVEISNHAIADLLEPGSTFKVASMMVALDAGVIKPKDIVDTGNGLYMYAGRRLTDHNINHGGYHEITAAETIWFSSNIGVAKIILKGFEKNPADYVDRLYAIGLNRQVNFNFQGEGYPIIKHPKHNKNIWWKTSLPWMSFGYETAIPPIYTLMFYNAIANDGVMIKPIFVKEIHKGSECVQKITTDTINPQICKPQTLADIRQMLKDVVKQGTAQAVKSDYVEIAGKTGTAQISHGKDGYHGNGTQHRVSFCGYFPADEPKYSAIVVISNPRIGYPSGGSMSGGVVRHIAEQIYAQGIQLCDAPNLPDSLHSRLPKIKNGNSRNTQLACGKVDVPCETLSPDDQWAHIDYTYKNKVSLKGMSAPPDKVPNVIGMGARDAIYLLEQAGMKVSISGKGKVVSQSLPGGTAAAPGQTVAIVLK
ncbi:MAG: transpeptidase family protein [Coprobacter sp.]|nr:transpeptidase family protein [Coprobacter sp.]